MTVHARARGAETWWKSFTTGKSAELLGGVPHDVYGMTSLSVRQYVLGIYKQLGLREKDITKVQTGGPGTYPICLWIWTGRLHEYCRWRPWFEYVYALMQCHTWCL